MTAIIVIGAGQAGAALAAKLRALGYQGALTMIGEETAPPYQRPPLSKGYLMGIDHERFTFRFQGRQFRLTDVHGKVVKPILA